jgi:hypothetical protein
MNLVPVNDIKTMAEAVAKSGLFGVKTADEAMALMLIAQAEGQHPAIAARDYHIIQGKPALKADAMLARFQAAGGKVEWKAYTDECVTGIFSHPSGGSITVDWTIRQAQGIGLVKPGSGWIKYPRAMLRSRCISEGIRAVYPGCVVGTYSVEEVQDFDDKPTKTESPKVKDMGAAEVVEEIKQAKVEGGNFLPLYIPDTEEPYGKSTDLEGWEISFHDLVHKIKASQKLNDESKRDKLKRLKEVNHEVIDTLDAATKMRVIAASNSLEEI